MSDTWSVDEHLADVLGSVRPLEPIELRLLDAQGCVLVEDVTVPASLPPFDNSSMDGYAVRAAGVAAASDDTPVVLTVVGDIAAGSSDLPTVGHGQAARIMTGAPLPPGADAVVPVEWTDGGLGGGPAESMAAASASPDGARGEVRVHRPAEPGAHVRKRGSDVTVGTVALYAGTVLGSAQIGLLAAIGRGTVLVRPRPRVVVLSTGSELVQPGEALGPGQIHDSNSFMLTSAAREAGAIAYRVGAVGDDPATLRSTVEDQLVRADVLVTSGGVSVGAYDVVKETLSRFGTGAGPGERDGDVSAHRAATDQDRDLETDTDADADADTDTDGGPGADADAETETVPVAAGGTGARGAAAGAVQFRKLAMQPGKPQGFGLIGAERIPVLALPGNPVSSFVSFQLFVRPVIRALMGLEPVHRPQVRARLETPKDLTSPEGRRQYLRGAYTPPEPGELLGTVRPVGGAGSHLTGALAQANALLVLPESTTTAAAGEEVTVLPLD